MRTAFFAASLLLLCPAARAQELVIADNGKSDFRIVVAADATAAEKHAAAELRLFLKQMTGAELAVADDKGEPSPREILVGDSAHFRKLDVFGKIDRKALGREGYTLRTVAGPKGQYLLILGASPRGTLYGVYGLLEDHLGCHWFTPAVSRIPSRPRLALGKLNQTVTPVLEYREPFVVDCFDPDWAARNRMNGRSARLDDKHGGSVCFGAGLFCHTFEPLCPVGKYFDKHPEYFSEIKGKRTRDHTQLCCTNPEVVKIVTAAVLERIRKDPRGTAYSVSQNDWYSYCTCKSCAALAAREESQMAPVLTLVNQVAEAVEKEFPDAAIETLAYQWTRKPCKTLRPRKNVIIRLCSIECCFAHSLEGCDSKPNKDFVRDIQGWAKMADRLWIWNYCTSFAHYYTPFPTLRTLDDNIRFFVRHNVKGIFEQDNYQSPNGDLSSLGGYMMAKFLWDTSYDENRAMNEFIEGVYGPAGKFIRQYVDLLHDKVAKDNIHMQIWIGPNVPFLTDEIVAKANGLWEQAEAAVAKQPDVLERVKFARLSLDYAIVERARMKAGKNSSPADAFVKAAAERLFTLGKRAGVRTIREASTPLEQYRKTCDTILGPAQ
ncbi:MAG TPA: DUF4838 domain-containing protein [Phycisphaerae bacterium]|nr:DUF4838 domain-containing protein [Phycisphaerae bacterium]HQL72271.1 DUF4838 domain-containing protein [Phycisphaerae bacterium]